MKRAYVKLNAAQQLAAQLRKQIEGGVWLKGDSLPPMRDIAGRYGVSLSTVQRAVRELASLELIDYQAGQSGVVKSAISVQTAADRQIVWVEPLDPEVHTDVWGQAMQRAARGVLTLAGLRVTYVTFHLYQGGYLDQVMRMIEPIIDQTAGIYCQDYYGLLKPVLDYAEQKGVAWMTSTPSNDAITHNFVAADNLGAGQMTGRCFARLGTQHVAMLHAGMNNRSAQNKAGGLCLGYFEQQISPPVIDLVGAYDQEEPSGYEAMRKYLKSHKPPEGIFTTGDYLAMGAVRACKEIGLRVPEDVSVIGSTGIARSILPFSPSLAAVAQPMAEMGEQLASSMVYMIREGVRRIRGRVIPCRYVAGQSFNAPEDLQRQWALDGSAEAETEYESNSAADVVEQQFHSSEVHHELRV